MLREEPPGRFDYLFEPLDVDESAGHGQEDARRPLPDDDGGWSRRIVLACVELATLAAAAATAIVLVQPAVPAQDVVVPADATPQSTTPSMSTVVASTPESPVPVAPATESLPEGLAPTATPTPEPQPPPLVQSPTTIATEPEPPATMPQAPPTRAPISVSPSSRAPFPDQTPPRKNNEGHGLFGGRGLL